MATFEDFKKIEFRVGKIISAEKIISTDKLVKLEVSFGEFGTRQIIAGIGLHFVDLGNIVGKKFAFVANLETRIIKGLESQGMILAASDDKYLSLLNVDDAVTEGSLIK